MTDFYLKKKPTKNQQYQTKTVPRKHFDKSFKLITFYIQCPVWLISSQSLSLHIVLSFCSELIYSMSSYSCQHGGGGGGGAEKKHEGGTVQHQVRD